MLTHVPGVPAATHKNPVTTYLLGDEPSSDGALFFTESPTAHDSVVGAVALAP